MSGRDAGAVRATGGAGGNMSTILSLACGLPGCDRTFGSKLARDSHLMYQHRIGIVDPLGYPCRVSTCTASFGTAANRDEHMHDAHRSGPAEKRLDAAAGRAPSSAGTVLRAPDAGPGEDDTSGNLPEDAGSSPAPRSEDAGATPAQGGGEPMATKWLCEEPGCDHEPFDTQQGLRMHVTRAHRGLGNNGGRSRKPTRKAPRRVQSNGHRRGDPAKNLVVIKLDRLVFEGLLELVMDAGGSIDLADPEDLRREAGRLQLLAALQEGVSS